MVWIVLFEVTALQAIFWFYLMIFEETVQKDPHQVKGHEENETENIFVSSGRYIFWLRLLGMMCCVIRKTLWYNSKPVAKNRASETSRVRRMPLNFFDWDWPVNNNQRLIIWMATIRKYISGFQRLVTAIVWAFDNTSVSWDAGRSMNQHV